MIKDTSSAEEIRDLQRLLLGAGLIEFDSTSVDGVWGDETQAAVLRLYTHLGWEHGATDRWVTAPALAAIASVLHHHGSDEADSGRTGPGIGGGGSYSGGGGSYSGGGGSYSGGGGSYSGGGGSYSGGGGSYSGGGGSYSGGGGSYSGGGADPE